MTKRGHGEPLLYKKLDIPPIFLAETCSVAIAEWDNGRWRAICSGAGHVMDERGNALLHLGKDQVPHGQEVRVARFIQNDPRPQMIIRYNGHTPDVMVVDTQGNVRNKFELNPSPNNTGMEAIYWNGRAAPAVLYNGGMLWKIDRVPGQIGEASVALPELPPPAGPSRMGWYHCIPADVCGDSREEILLYNPWDTSVYIYTPHPLTEDAYERYRPSPRQYNARLMD